MAKRKTNKHSTISQLIAQTDISNQLKISNKHLLQIKSVWKNWPDKQLTANCQPVHFKNNELIFLTHSAIFSSKLRHSQKKIISFFNQAGIESITKITISNQPSVMPNGKTKADDGVADRTQPSEENISLLSSNANSFANEKLKQTVNKLTKTLKKLSD